MGRHALHKATPRGKAIGTLACLSCPSLPIYNSSGLSTSFVGLWRLVDPRPPPLVAPDLSVLWAIRGTALDGRLYLVRLVAQADKPCASDLLRTMDDVAESLISDAYPTRSRSKVLSEATSAAPEATNYRNHCTAPDAVRALIYDVSSIALRVNKLATPATGLVSVESG
jgi:hypothetical protein